MICWGRHSLYIELLQSHCPSPTSFSPLSALVPEDGAKLYPALQGGSISTCCVSCRYFAPVVTSIKTGGYGRVGPCNYGGCSPKVCRNKGHPTRLSLCVEEISLGWMLQIARRAAWSIVDVDRNSKGTSTLWEYQQETKSSHGFHRHSTDGILIGPPQYFFRTLQNGLVDLWCYSLFNKHRLQQPHLDDHHTWEACNQFTARSVPIVNLSATISTVIRYVDYPSRTVRHNKHTPQTLLHGVTSYLRTVQ